jgi:hypothetical protein
MSPVGALQRLHNVHHRFLDKLRLRQSSHCTLRCTGNMTHGRSPVSTIYNGLHLNKHGDLHNASYTSALNGKLL